jgi:hypothetical protein
VPRTGPIVKIDNSKWSGRRGNARAFLKAALDLLALANEGDNGNPIMSQALLAVIAYSDALTIKIAGIKNAQDHTVLPATLSKTLQGRSDPKQIERLKRMISEKNSIQYDQVTTTLHEARTYVQQAQRFAQWAEAKLAFEL